VLAGFGEAQLVRTLDMKYEIRGGSEEDREAAFDWIGKFFPDLVWIAAFPNCRPMENGEETIARNVKCFDLTHLLNVETQHDWFFPNR